MKDYTNYRKEPDMKMVSAKIIWKKNLKSEGTNIKVNGENSEIIENTNTPYFCIVRNYGIEQKNDLEERIMYFDKFYSIKRGDYVEYNGDTYLTTSKRDKDNPVFDTIKMTWCNQVLTLEGMPSQPCFMKNSSYGSKGIVTNNQYSSDFDSRGIIIVQKNKYTDKLYEGFRMIFNHSKNDVYQITKINSAFSVDYYEIICKYVKYVQEDDFENNIAYNPTREKNIKHCEMEIPKIKGKDIVVVGTTEQYKLCGYDKEIIWTLDEDSVECDIAEIISTSGNVCTISFNKNEMCQIEARDKETNKIIEVFTIYPTLET